MKFSIKDFFSKCDQIRSFLRIWRYLLKKSLMENFIFCKVFYKSRKALRGNIYLEKKLTTSISDKYSRFKPIY